VQEIGNRIAWAVSYALLLREPSRENRSTHLVGKQMGLEHIGKRIEAAAKLRQELAL
jgi:hypothetical protein